MILCNDDQKEWAIRLSNFEIAKTINAC